MKTKATSNELLDQPSPSDLDAERGVLGSIMLDGETREKVAFLKPCDFFLKEHATLFRVLMEMGPIDDVLLVATLRASGKLEDIGGMAYLSEIVQSVPMASHAIHYAKIVKETALRRALVRLNCEVLKAAYSGRWTARELADRQVARLKQIFSEVDHGS
jgi:replicative DNA helicase